MFTKNLSNGYIIKEMTAEDFWPLWDLHSPPIFRDTYLNFPWRQHISEKETADISSLQKNIKPFKLRLGVFKDDEFAGWTFGDQKSSDDYYMRNSAVLPEHRRKGLYTELLMVHMELATAQGFQRITSNHILTNNSIIIPKLKAGFVITGFELDDGLGMLLTLAYYTNPLRRKMLDVRAGSLRPDDEIKKALGL